MLRRVIEGAVMIGALWIVSDGIELNEYLQLFFVVLVVLWVLTGVLW